MENNKDNTRKTNNRKRTNKRGVTSRDFVEQIVPLKNGSSKRLVHNKVGKLNIAR